VFEGMVPYKGKTKNVVYQLVGGLKSSMGYTVTKQYKKCKIIVSLSLFQKQELEKVTYMMFDSSN
jgi:IMP dehydrogenase